MGPLTRNSSAPVATNASPSLQITVKKSTSATNKDESFLLSHFASIINERTFDVPTEHMANKIEGSENSNLAKIQVNAPDARAPEIAFPENCRLDDFLCSSSPETRTKNSGNGLLRALGLNDESNGPNAG